MMNIPGLDLYLPHADESEGTLDLTSFTGTFSIPKSQIHGGYRSISDYERGSLLLKTSSWVLYKSTTLNKDLQVIIKQYKKSEPSENANEVDLVFLRQKIFIMNSLKHDNIIKLLDIAVGKSLDCGKTYFIFENCECFLTELMENKIDGLYEKPMIKCIIRQIFQALDYIHRQNIMHRDIHPKNIMFQRDGRLKLTNFSNAREFSSKDLKLEDTCLNYMAPENILEAPTHGSPIDIWAAGCLLSELFLRRKIFPGDDDLVIFLKICNILGCPHINFWPECSSLLALKGFTIDKLHGYNCVRLFFDRYSPQTCETIDLLRTIFIYDPSKRTTAEKCLQHPYFLQESPKASTLAEVSQMLGKYELTKLAKEPPKPEIITVQC